MGAEGEDEVAKGGNLVIEVGGSVLKGTTESARHPRGKEREEKRTRSHCKQ